MVAKVLVKWFGLTKYRVSQHMHVQKWSEHLLPSYWNCENQEMNSYPPKFPPARREVIALWTIKPQKAQILVHWMYMYIQSSVVEFEIAYRTYKNGQLNSTTTTGCPQ